MNPEQSAELRRRLTEAATAELQRSQLLTTEIAAAHMFRQNPNATNADHIRQVVYAASASIGASDMGRGYRVLGGTPATAPYLMRGKSKPTDAELIADAAMGWLAEIADRQQAVLNNLRPAQSSPKPVLVIESRNR